MDGGELRPITFEAYEAAYRRFITCLEDSSIGVIEHGFDSHTQRFEYATEGGDPEIELATGRTPADDCYEREFADADERWQFQLEAPFAQANFDRARAFFAARGVIDLPAGLAESLNIGWLIHHAVELLGEHVATEFTESEARRDREERDN